MPKTIKAELDALRERIVFCEGKIAFYEGIRNELQAGFTPLAEEDSRSLAIHSETKESLTRYLKHLELNGVSSDDAVYVQTKKDISANAEQYLLCGNGFQARCREFVNQQAVYARAIAFWWLELAKHNEEYYNKTQKERL